MTNKLRELRVERGLSQQEVADVVGVTAGLIGQIERGEKQGSVTTLRKLAAFFNVSMELLATNLEPA